MPPKNSFAKQVKRGKKAWSNRTAETEQNYVLNTEDEGESVRYGVESVLT